MVFLYTRIFFQLLLIFRRSYEYWRQKRKPSYVHDKLQTTLATCRTTSRKELRCMLRAVKQETTR